MKFIDYILITLIVLMIIAGIVIPIILVTSIDFSQKSIKETISILGGSSSPFISISAILIVIYSFLYQRRNDLKLQSKELILNSLSNIKEEFKSISIKTTTTTGSTKTENVFEGRSALKNIVKNLNSEDIDLDVMNYWIEAKSMMNIYKVINILIDDLILSQLLSTNEKRILLIQIHLFYYNNLLIDKKQRGDVYCDYHGTTHKFPEKWKLYIYDIEAKLKKIDTNLAVMN